MKEIDELSSIIDNIKNNLIKADQSLFIHIFELINYRLNRIEKRLKPGMFEWLALIASWLNAIAIFVLAIIILVTLRGCPPP